MNEWKVHIESELEERNQAGLLRHLPNPPVSSAIDFCSNDYLGLARSEKLKNRVEAAWHQYNRPLGATGSRLISGNHLAVQELETFARKVWDSEAALYFDSGYSANTTLISSLADRHTTILYDALCHASIREGIALSRAKAHGFKHNDLHDLTNKLKQARGRLLIITESVFSMDGDLAPISDIFAISSKNNALLYVDEAHAGAVFGPAGRGLLADLRFNPAATIRLITLSKGFGATGAIALLPKIFSNYITNTGKGFIYTTGPSAFSCLLAKEAISQSLSEDDARKTLRYLQQYATDTLKLSEAESPIIAYKVPSIKYGFQLEEELSERQIATKLIRYPTVPEGSERLRISLHSFNSTQDIDLLANILL